MDNREFWVAIWILFLSVGLVVLHSSFLQHDLLVLAEHCK